MVSLRQSYEPFGDVLLSEGSHSTSYGYTGEWTDGTGLVHLRARYLDSGVGRFLSKDPLGIEVNARSFLNRWSYVEDNPIRYVDPTGWIKEDEAEEANEIVRKLSSTYQVEIKVDWKMEVMATYVNYLSVLGLGEPYIDRDCNWVEGKWSIKELKEVEDGVIRLANAMGGPARFVNRMGGVISVSQEKITTPGATYPPTYHVVKFWTSPTSFGHWEVVHELAHVWDFQYGEQLSMGLMEATGGYYSDVKSWWLKTTGQCDINDNGYPGRLPGCNEAGYFYGGVPPKTSDKNFNHKEDFAESVTAYIYPGQALNRKNEILEASDPKWYPAYYDLFYYSDYRDTTRWRYIDSIIRN